MQIPRNFVFDFIYYDFNIKLRSDRVKKKGMIEVISKVYNIIPWKKILKVFFKITNKNFIFSNIFLALLCKKCLPYLVKFIFSACVYYNFKAAWNASCFYA